METNRIIVRPGPERAEALARIGKQTFAETFVGLAYYTQEIVDGYTATAFTTELVRRELGDPRYTYFLLEQGGEVAGYAKLAERSPADCIRGLDAIYLERIYLAKSTQRSGLGTKLLHAVLDEARKTGRPWLWLSVWEHNKPAVAFYQKHGFTHSGDWDWAFESGGVRYVDRDRVMTIRLQDA